MTGEDRTLAVVHVFYPQFWQELAACLRHLEGALDIVVTYVEEAAVAQARRDFPKARFVRVANIGFDVWPFLKILGETDLSRYSRIVKLHTKRDFNPPFECRPFCGYDLRGPRWRERLLRFAATPESWARTLSRLADPSVGMVADDALIVRRGATVGASYREDFDRAAALLGLPSGGCGVEGAYVAGTMFAAKPAALAPMLNRRFAESDFAVSSHAAPEQFAHVCERALGLSVFAAGFSIVGCDNRPTYYRTVAVLGKIWFDVRRFVWQDKVTSRGRHLVKIFRIPVWQGKVQVKA